MYQSSRLLLVVRITLLAFIVIGLGLLFTQKMWVPKLVDFIILQEGTEK